MNKIEKGKNNLILVSSIVSLVSVALVIVSIALIVAGANTMQTSLVWGIILVILGSLLTLTFLAGIVLGLVMLFTGKALVATKGSVKQDNLAHGTVNMLKCENCGSELSGKEDFCSNCGKDLAKQTKCPTCGELVSASEKHCSKCGAKLN